MSTTTSGSSGSPNSFDSSERDNEEEGELQPQQPSSQYLSTAVNPGAGIGEDDDDVAVNANAEQPGHVHTFNESVPRSTR